MFKTKIVKALVTSLLAGLITLFSLFIVHQMMVIEPLNQFQNFWIDSFKTKTTSEMVRVLLQLVVIAPIIEEFIFRELLLGSLLKKFPNFFNIHIGIHLAIAALFAGLHTLIQGVFGILTFFPALYLGFIWQKNQSLLLNSLIHGMWNLLWIGAILFIF